MSRAGLSRAAKQQKPLFTVDDSDDEEMDFDAMLKSEVKPPAAPSPPSPAAAAGAALALSPADDDDGDPDSSLLDPEARELEAAARRRIEEARALAELKRKQSLETVGSTGRRGQQQQSAKRPVRSATDFSFLDAPIGAILGSAKQRSASAAAGAASLSAGAPVAPAASMGDGSAVSASGSSFDDEHDDDAELADPVALAKAQRAAAKAAAAEAKALKGGKRVRSAGIAGSRKAKHEPTPIWLPKQQPSLGAGVKPPALQKQRSIISSDSDEDNVDDDDDPFAFSTAEQRAKKKQKSQSHFLEVVPPYSLFANADVLLMVLLLHVVVSLCSCCRSCGRDAQRFRRR
jgi:hypothetical protein